MSMMVKDPDSRIDFEFDWATAYPDGQAIVASDWTIAPTEAGGVTAVGMAQSTATLAGGVAGHVYRVTNRVTLSDGQIDERSMTIRVEER